MCQKQRQQGKNVARVERKDNKHVQNVGYVADNVLITEYTTSHSDFMKTMITVQIT